MRPPTIARHSLGGRGAPAEIIYRSVLEAAVEHRLPPGAKLTEEQIGSIFGVSRATVRSALQALAHDHIVTLAPHRGAFVSAPTVEQARDVFAARKLVEAAIARDVASVIDETQIFALRGLLDEERAAVIRDDRGASIRLSGAFHVAVAATRGEGVLTAFLRGLISQSSLVIALYGRSSAWSCGHDEHVAFLLALQAHDVDRAVQVMENHLDHILDELDLEARTVKPVDLATALQIKEPGGGKTGVSSASAM